MRTVEVTLERSSSVIPAKAGIQGPY